MPSFLTRTGIGRVAVACVTLDRSDLAVRIDAGPAPWSLLPSTPGDLVVRRNGPGKSGGEDLPQ